MCVCVCVCVCVCSSASANLENKTNLSMFFASASKPGVSLVQNFNLLFSKVFSWLFAISSFLYTVFKILLK